MIDSDNQNFPRKLDMKKFTSNDASFLRPFVVSLLCLFLITAVVTGAPALPHHLTDRLNLPSEKVAFSIQLENGKVLSICIGPGGRYIIYRLGTQGSIEFVFPKNLDNSWAQFSYQYYLRGGGAANAGLDLNFLTFANNGYTYRIYEMYSAQQGSNLTGLTILTPAGDKIQIPGIYATKIGSLINLRNFYPSH